jgi:hypothetical protein
MGFSVYGRPDELAGLVDGSPSTETLLAVLGSASRQAEGPYGAGRHFFVWEGEKQLWNWRGTSVMEVPDLLAFTAVKEQPSRWTRTPWDEVTALPAGAVEMVDDEGFPVTRVRRVDGGVFDEGLWRYAMTGWWGYGDGRSGNPWAASGVTLTVVDATATTVTLSAAGTVLAGHTLRVGTEQLIVRSVTEGATVTASVVRGIHGTTAASHAGEAVTVMQWPEDLTRAVLWIAAADYRAMTAAGVTEFPIGDYREKRLPEGVNGRVLERIFGRLRRGG